MAPESLGLGGSRPPSILHAPADVGGNAFGFSRAERELGLNSDVLVIVGGPYGYGADMRLDLKGMPVWRRLASRVALLRRALRDYDLIHFNFGHTFLGLRTHGHILNELPLIKRAGKKILVTFQGCDVRPAAACNCTKATCLAEDAYCVPNAMRFLRYADRCFHLNPDLRRWLPGSHFIPYASVDPRLLIPADQLPPGDALVVAHAPTNRAAKGTSHVIEATRRLSAEGVPVRLDLIESVTRDEVLRRLRAADIVVDQLLVGWYGGIAVEAMALAKPVVCHIREDTPEDNPFGGELPLVRATAETLTAELRRLAVDRDLRSRVGAAGRAFVERRHDPRAVVRDALAGIVELPCGG